MYNGKNSVYHNTACSRIDPSDGLPESVQARGNQAVDPIHFQAVWNSLAFDSITFFSYTYTLCGKQRILVADCIF